MLPNATQADGRATASLRGNEAQRARRREGADEGFDGDFGEASLGEILIIEVLNGNTGTAGAADLPLVGTRREP